MKPGIPNAQPQEKGLETDPDLLLQQGINAVKKGNKDKARQYLLQVIEMDDHNKRAWLWLSDAMQDPQDKAVCLENVLTIDPLNSAARYGLQKLHTQYPEVFHPQPEKEPQAQTSVSELSAAVQPTRQETPKPKPVPQKEADDGQASVRICVHCGAPNPGWRDLCHMCKKRIDGSSETASAWESPAPFPDEEVDEVTFKTEFDTRPLGILSLGAAWIAAVALNKRGAYEYEVFGATTGRTIAGIVIGAVAIPALFILMVGLLLATSSASEPLVMITSLAATPLVLILWAVAGAIGVIVHFYTWSGANYLVAWALGGKGSFLVHSQLLSIAYSASTLTGTILLAISSALIDALVEFSPSGTVGAMGLLSIILMLLLCLLVGIYSILMQGQAISVAHRISWGGGIGSVVISSLLYGLVSILLAFLLLLLTNTHLGDLPFAANLTIP